MRWQACLILLAAACCVTSGAEATPTAAPRMSFGRLRCELLDEPLGIDERRPRLSWILSSDQRGARQTAYQVLVASSEAHLAGDNGDLWNSGEVRSDETVGIEYRGAPLEAGRRVWWKVRVWDGQGRPSAWSDPSSWEMGLLSDDDWHGKWIARNESTEVQPLPLVRREFRLDGKVKRASAYVTGLGYYELHINGRRVGDRCLDPGYTRYDKRVLYATYDVTDTLQSGQNAVGVMLGNGWFNVQTAAAWDFDAAPWRASPRMLLELHVELEDGRTEIISSDEQWKTAAGPIVFSSIYGGETYDARREQAGWDAPGFDDHEWEAAVAVDAPKGRLVAQAMHPIKSTQELTPVAVTNPAPGVYVFDAGQNLAGVAELRVSGVAGTKVAMKYSELLDREGRADQSNIGVHVWKKGKDQQFQTDGYILKGEDEERWQARFVYHGFQYVEVTGAPGPLTVDNLRLHVMHSAVPEVGRFECSNPLFNRILENARWSFLSNFFGIPTDCPHREKNGWTGDAHLACEQALWTFDAATVYEKWINDLADEQQPDGKLPGIVPTGGWGYAWGNGPAWDSAFLLIPQYLHLYSGDSRVRQRMYEGHRRYVDYLSSRAERGIVKIGLGDWSPAKTETPPAVTSTGYYYVDARNVAETARLLDRKDEAAHYDQLADSIRTDFNREFFDPEKGAYAGGSQTAQSCALYQELVADEDKARVVETLLANIEAADGHIDAGILGAKYLLHALSARGQADVAYRIASQVTQPSWGWWIRQGATTLWEGWGPGASHNHIFFGDIVNWFFRTLAGINPDPAAPGFKHFVIKPQPVGDLTWARASYDSVRGRIESDWSIEGRVFRLRVVIPANTMATVYLPGVEATAVREGGAELGKVEGVRLAGVDTGSIRLEVGSGEYTFTAPMK